MKKYLFITAIGLLAFTGCKKDRKSIIMHNYAEKMNKSCPMRMDSLVVIDSTKFIDESNTMNYYYSVSGSLDNKKFLEENYDLIETNLKSALDNSVEMEKYRKYNVILSYRYYSESTDSLLTVFNFTLK